MRIATLTLGSSLLFLASCGGSGGTGGGPTAPASPILTLALSPSALGLSGTAEVAVSTRNADGSVLANATVTLETSLGVLAAASLITGTDGRASTLLRGDGRTGMGTVRAHLGSVNAEATLRIGIGVSVSLRTEPATISTTGTSEVFAVVSRLDGQATPVGTVVQLTTTLGRLSDPAPRTDARGAAHVQLAGDGRVGIATMTATTAEAVEPARADVRIVDSQVSLQSIPAAIAGDGRATVLVSVRDANGGPVGAGVQVRLATTLGRLDNTLPVTDTLGQATATLLGNNGRGKATVTATADGASASLDVQIGQGLALTLRAAPEAITPNGNTLISLLAILPGGQPVAIGTEVLFTTSLGKLDVDRSNVQETAIASTILRGTGVKGTARVTARVAGFAEQASLDVPIR
ncbi:MAG: hypothetical protein ABI609_06825 [Acidobacteriota bacterium]